MKKNIGYVDRIVGLLLSTGLIAVYFVITDGRILAYFALAVAVLVIASSVINYWPLYSFMGNRAHKKIK